MSTIWFTQHILYTYTPVKRAIAILGFPETISRHEAEDHSSPRENLKITFALITSLYVFYYTDQQQVFLVRNYDGEKLKKIN